MEQAPTTERQQNLCRAYLLDESVCIFRVTTCTSVLRAWQSGGLPQQVAGALQCSQRHLALGCQPLPRTN